MKIETFPRSILVILSLVAITLSLTLSARAQVETVLYSFPSLGSNGANPDGGLIFDSAGNMYGVTELGGQTDCYRSTYGCGMVYEMSPNGTGGWTETPLYAFTGGTDGNFPTNNLVMDGAGNLYGVTVTGGDNSCNYPYGCGVVFELTPGSSGWTETVLHTFTSAATDGQGPNSLIRDAAGNLYGTTALGGASNSGTVFKLSNGSSGWTESVLFSFDGATQGANANGLVMDSSGNLYGTTGFGGNNSFCHQGCGVVFKLVSGSVGWHETVLHAFNGPTDGIEPNGVILDASGHLYGTTYYGGNTTCNTQGCGTVFGLAYGVSGWRESVIHKFSAADGKNPTANLVEDASGNLYGTTFFGGNTNSECGSGYGCGVVFKLSKASGRWLPSLTHVFHFADGAKPASNLVFDAAGNLYGTAQDGGAHKYGAVFEIQP
ncbi:MAG TPA: choice-of-anchor tandem repeat GloVer-containing protein [Candidatus Sulfotelmatobacter sp.]